VLASNHILLISASEEVGITGVSHYTWPVAYLILKLLRKAKGSE
jgi:hypothetical protein